jgi:hypothetical protein
MTLANEEDARAAAIGPEPPPEAGLARVIGLKEPMDVNRSIKLARCIADRDLYELFNPEMNRVSKPEETEYSEIELKPDLAGRHVVYNSKGEPLEAKAGMTTKPEDDGRGLRFEFQRTGALKRIDPKPKSPGKARRQRVKESKQAMKLEAIRLDALRRAPVILKPVTDSADFDRLVAVPDPLD